MKQLKGSRKENCIQPQPSIKLHKLLAESVRTDYNTKLEMEFKKKTIWRSVHALIWKSFKPLICKVAGRVCDPQKKSTLHGGMTKLKLKKFVVEIISQ